MARRTKGQKVDGWLVVDKPVGMTSTQVVGRARRVFDARKVGHGGTLDPLASGVLPIALGEATKTVAYAMEGEKAYRFTLRWGLATDTDDAEGEVVARSDLRPSDREIEACLPAFEGEITQVPPRFSAIKVAGRRAYDMARAREDFELQPRTITIKSLTLVERPDLDHTVIDVVCGKGAYMRSLARDLGLALGTCAYITALRRLRVGPFRVEGAISLETLEGLGHSPAALELLLPLESALDDIPALALSETEAQRLRCGQALPMLSRMDRLRVEGLENGATVLTTAGGKPVALARYQAGDLCPVRVLNL